MINRKYKRYKPIYKKFIRLRVNAKNNEKILSFKKKKWKSFIEYLQNSSKIYRVFKPFTYNSYKVSKFASSGNSYSKKFRNDLVAKKILNSFYGELLLGRYLKKRVREIYRSKKFRNSKFLYLEFLESRLDSVLYRSKLGFSMSNARQLISHKHVKVNNKIERNSSYILKQGDFIKIDLQALSKVKNSLERQPSKSTYKKSRHVLSPSFLKINYKSKFLGNRLDSVLYESKLGFSMSNARQLISHKHVKVNNKIERNSSYLLKQGDSIKIDLQAMNEIKYVLWPIPPSYLTINYNTMEIIFGDITNFNFAIQFPFSLNLDSIITNYYRH